MRRKAYVWTEQEVEYLKQIVVGKSYKEITELMSKKFNYEFDIEQISGKMKRMKLRTYRDSKLKKGCVALNKGKKGIHNGSSSSFKKGHIPKNHLEVGSEVLRKDGYINLKVEEPNIWKLKHRVMYERYHNVELSDSDIVLLLDGNKQNFDKDNLFKINKKQLSRLNQMSLIKGDKDLTITAIELVNLVIKMNEVKKKLK